MMTFILENYDLLIIAVIVVAAIVVAVRKISAMSKEQICAWLLQAVILAEKEFGGGTGRLKLATVYDKFITRFPIVSKFVSFAKFGELVDVVLKEAEKLLSSNAAIANIVNGIK